MKPLLWAIMIFFCASLFRLTSLDLIEFKLDEARDVYEMVQFYKSPHLFELGPIQSTGVYNPPLWYYFLALLSLPSRDPQYLSFMIALFNCLAIGGFYLMVNKYYGHRPALVSSLFLAFSPWSILLSRKIWSPDILMVFLVPLFYFIHKVHLEGVKAHLRGGKWSIFWVVLLLSLLAQIHASGLFLAAAVITIIIILKVIKVIPIQVNLKFAILGLAVSLIPLLPYIGYQIGSGCEDCQALFAYQDEVKTFDPTVFLRPLQFINGSSFDLVLGEDHINFLDEYAFLKPLTMLFLFELLLPLIGIWFIIKKNRGHIFLFLIPAIVSVLYFVTKIQAHMYYFLILAPLMSVIYALSFEPLFHLRGILAWGLITVIIAINIIFGISFYQFLSKRQNIQGDYGPIYRITKQLADEKLSQYKDNPNYQLIRSEFYIKLFTNFN